MNYEKAGSVWNGLLFFKSFDMKIRFNPPTSKTVGFSVLLFAGAVLSTFVLTAFANYSVYLFMAAFLVLLAGTLWRGL